ncbi:MAG: hypothetical protein JXR23_05215 [Pontiellaceae bacterium]|nr:hypothetical protein [Pontiellaceae bacterium]
MKNKSFNKRYLFSLTLTVLIVLVTSAQAGSRWDWADMSDEELAFCDEHMPEFLEIRKTQGDEAALKELDRLFPLAEEELGHNYFLDRVVWYEAQAHSGKVDEAWGLTLYEYLYNRDIDLNTQPLHLSAADYVIHNNIMVYCLNLGKAAKAREYILRVENSLINDRHFDLTGESYEDRGPVFSFLDEARNRDFPIFHHDLTPSLLELDENPEDLRDFFYYPTMYGINYVAETAFRSGDWVKAAELCAWCIQYADEYVIDQSTMTGEVYHRGSFGSRTILADIALFHRYPDEAVRFLEKTLEQENVYDTTTEPDKMRAWFKLMKIKIQQGEPLPENVLEKADEAAEMISEYWFYSLEENMQGILDKARIYHAVGKKAEAWEIVNELFKEAQQDVNPRRIMRVMDTAIDLALADGGTHPELENWLKTALTDARKMGDKFKEIPLYEKYADFLVLKERYAEALTIQQEAVRLSQAVRLPKRLAENQTRLADIQKQMPTSSIVKIERTDIQPRLSYSAALPEQAVHGRFYLHNPSIKPSKGTLLLTGPIEQTAWVKEQEWLMLSTSPLYKEAESSLSITLGTGKTCVIDITGVPLENGAGGTVNCQWIPEGAEDASAFSQWNYEAAQTEKRTAIIDAHEFIDNPYYLIPINHMLQRIDSNKAQAVDFSVSASNPMRIESYDAASGQLLAVDADGDGDFLDAGDLVVGDTNQNNWPDLFLKAEDKRASLVMYVKPLAPITQEIELIISIQVDGTWQTDATDVIKPSE